MRDDSELTAQIDELRNNEGVGEDDVCTDDMSIPAEFSDDALALRFTEKHKDDLRYVAGWGKWMVRESAIWRPDDTLQVFNLVRRVCREAAAECESDKLAAAVASAKTVAAVEKLARSDRRHAMTADDWDKDLWLLNTPAGVVDLRTGQMRPHRPDDYMTKITAVAPGGECPLFMKFRDRITAGDKELQAFLKRVAGYSLTGVTNEHAMFFGYGTGANGKSTLANALSGIMNTYAAIAPMETFIASPNDRHPTDLAMLQGARLVVAQETEEGRHWAENKIKQITTGDPISARFMRQDFFTYTPQFKLMIVGNNKPSLRGVDEAMRRRMNLIPFTVCVPKQERHQKLPEKLKEEWPGILAWMVEGCLEWQRIGLAPPASVVSATEKYLETEDSLAIWLRDCCTVGDWQEAGLIELFGSWKRWAEAAGEQPGARKRFVNALEGRGFEHRRLASGRYGFRGVGLRAEHARWESEPEQGFGEI
jgi:putative DNA primase/helicase